MSRRNQYEINYARLEEILGRPPADLKDDRAYHYRASGFMDLSVEVLPACEETGAQVLSLCHYRVVNGDMCQDPEMTVRVFPPGSTAFTHMVPSTDSRHGRVEALMFQQAQPPIYQEVYPEPGKYHPRLRRELNDFLGFWLRNLREQGHRLADPDETDAT